MKEAEKICNYLLNKHLIACANYFPIKSAFWWNGKIENSKEIVSIIKTKKENWPKVQKEIKKLHPYKVPCIMKINLESNKDYDSWIKTETKP